LLLTKDRAKIFKKFKSSIMICDTTKGLTHLFAIIAITML